MVYLCIFLGQWCYLFHPLQPNKKSHQKTVYKQVLDIFTKPAKKCNFYVAAAGFFFGRCLGIFHCRSLRTIAYRFNLDIDTPE